MMDTKAFKKSCFDLVTEANNVRVNDPDTANMIVKEDDDGLWIRFTAIGSLLDYCENNITESVFVYCLQAVAIAMLIEDFVKRDQK